MRGRLEITITQGELPDDLTVGAENEVRCTARIYSASVDQIDITPYGAAEPQTVDGETTVRVEAVAGGLFPVNA